MLCVFLLNWFNALAQKRDSAILSQADTSQKSFVAKMQAFARSAAKKSANEFEDDKAIATQNRIFDEVRTAMQKAKVYLRTSVDTLGTKKGIKRIRR